MREATLTTFNQLINHICYPHHFHWRTLRCSRRTLKWGMKLTELWLVWATPISNGCFWASCTYFDNLGFAIFWKYGILGWFLSKVGTVTASMLCMHQLNWSGFGPCFHFFWIIHLIPLRFELSRWLMNRPFSFHDF